MTEQAPESLSQILARSLAGERSDPAIYWHGQTYDWGWVADAAEQVTKAIAATGVTTAAPTAFIPRQRPEAAGAFLGMVASGRSMTMIYSYQTVDAMAADVRKLRLPVVIAHEQDWQAPLIDAAREIGCAGISLTEDGDAVAVPGLERVGPGEHRSGPDQPAIELLTSGTTGPPKRHPVYLEEFRKQLLDSSFKLGDGEGDRRPNFMTVPLANISGIYGFIVAAAVRNATVMEEKFTLSAWLDFVRTYRPASINGPPALVKMILDADVAPEDLASASCMVMGMGPVDPEIRRAFEAKYGIPILPCYGATEFAGTATAMTMDDHLRYGEAKFGSVGRPISGVALRIVDQETGEALPMGEEHIGLVHVQIEAIGPEWIKTTDLGFLDDEGYLYLRGRSDGVIIRGGFKIHPSAIESVLLQHPAVAACSVVGLPHERLGHVPVAAVEPKPGVDAPSPAELDTWLRKHLPATNIPADYRLVAELPRTPSLKIRLDAVRELFAQSATSS